MAMEVFDALSQFGFEALELFFSDRGYLIYKIILIILLFLFLIEQIYINYKNRACAKENNGNFLDWKSGANIWPLRLKAKKRLPILGILLFIAALPMGFFSLGISKGVICAGVISYSGSELIFLCVSITLVCFLFAAHFCFRKKNITLTKKEVTVSERQFFKDYQWNEDLRNYTGVGLCLKKVPGYFNQYYENWEIVLLHMDRKKEVPLYSTFPPDLCQFDQDTNEVIIPDDLQSKSEEYANLFEVQFLGVYCCIREYEPLDFTNVKYLRD